MTTEIKRFTFRLPVDVYEQIEKIAKENYRSVTAEIIVAIQEYVKEHSDVSEPPKS
ncbi:Arc family DNA-binding protein [Allofustis seminis]|uniref:Arc family DNA-binding protein n=1 Tax=Allofustis seminis TaxID=166939 RepID=UPI00036CB38A|nr:Arc family DNA-binding protein [Allofustis seminis]